MPFGDRPVFSNESGAAPASTPARAAAHHKRETCIGRPKNRGAWFCPASLNDRDAGLPHLCACVVLPRLTALPSCSAASSTGAARHRSLRAPRSPMYIHEHDEQQPRLTRGRCTLGAESGPVGRARGGRAAGATHDDRAEHEAAESRAQARLGAARELQLLPRAHGLLHLRPSGHAQ